MLDDHPGMQPGKSNETEGNLQENLVSLINIRKWDKNTMKKNLQIKEGVRQINLLWKTNYDKQGNVNIAWLFLY